MTTITKVIKKKYDPQPQEAPAAQSIECRQPDYLPITRHPVSFLIKEAFTEKDDFLSGIGEPTENEDFWPVNKRKVLIMIHKKYVPRKYMLPEEYAKNYWPGKTITLHGSYSIADEEICFIYSPPQNEISQA